MPVLSLRPHYPEAVQVWWNTERLSQTKRDLEILLGQYDLEYLNPGAPENTLMTMITYSEQMVVARQRDFVLRYPSGRIEVLSPQLFHDKWRITEDE